MTSAAGEWRTHLARREDGHQLQTLWHNQGFNGTGRMVIACGLITTDDRLAKVGE
jgi:hypothetical protein